MNNLYVFAIGGSGERVMKSLVMMLASGVPIGAKRLIPVFVDNDTQSQALTSCLELISYYNSNPQKNKTGNVGLHFLCKSSGLNATASFAHADISEPILLNVAGNQIGTLDSIIGQLNTKDPVQDSLDEEKNLLFTKDDLDMPLNVGFVGNPNIGSVVLNSLSLNSPDFQSIYQGVGNNDGVFVIGSLFGGTGAAGFPLIINKFKALPQNACPLLGGVAVLPYFNVSTANSSSVQPPINTEKYNVDSGTFSSKTRAALMYYDEYMRNMDYMYYVGDNKFRSTYPSSVGGTGQKNPYNIIELMAAESVLNFSFADTNYKPDNVVYKMPVGDFSGTDGTIANVSSIRNKELRKALVKFQMMKYMFESPDFLKWGIDQNHEYVVDIKFSQEILGAVNDVNRLNNYSQAWCLRQFFDAWNLWMSDLKDAKRVKRQLVISSNDAKGITRDNISGKFYADNKNGIAKTETHKEGGFLGFGGKEVIGPKSPEIEDAMLQACRSLKISKATASESTALSTLMVIISKALDDVLANNCDL